MRIRLLAPAVALALLPFAWNAVADDAKRTDVSAEGGEAPVPESAVPAAVRAAAARVLAGVVPTGWTKESENGVDVYEAEYAVEGGKGSVSFTGEGEFLEREEHVASVPARVLERIGALHPGASVVSSAVVRRRYFEMKIKVGDKTHEVIVDAAGTVLAEEGADDEDDDEKPAAK